MSPPRPARRLVRYVARPVARFLEIEAASAIVLVAATAVALTWANSPWSAGYHSLWDTEAPLRLGPLDLAFDLRHWVNDGLMALFFFVVGLEIKRELVGGRLADRRDALLPAVAALGGMVVPAIAFVALTAGGPGSSGWGIPMATDIAFALGVLALLGERVPAALQVLLLGLAIVDDIGAISIIAIFYSDHLEPMWLIGALVGIAVVMGMRRADVRAVPAYVAVGTVTWACAAQSGVHATIAGVALGLLTPAEPLEDDEESVAERLEGALHPWTSFGVLPVFALANAGISLGADALGDAAGSALTAAVVVGLVGGKLVGITLFAWLAVRLGLARLPADLAWRHIVGMAAVAGVGFTVSIFVANLAFTDLALQAQAKVGVLVGSLLAAALGSILLFAASRPDRLDTGSQ